MGAAGLIVKIETDADVVGWGEGTGRFETDPNTLLAGKDVANIEGAIAALEAGGIGKGPMSGIEMALWDAMGKRADLPVCKLLGGVVREEVDFCACMGLKAPSESAATAREYMERWGFRFLKTKAGDDSEQDLQIAEAIQAAVGDEAILRPDANSGYSPQRQKLQCEK